MIDYTFSESSGQGNDTIPRLMKKMNQSFSKSKRYFEAAFSGSGELKEEKKSTEPAVPPPKENIEEVTIDIGDKGGFNLDDIQSSLYADADSAASGAATALGQQTTSSTTTT